MFRVWNKIGDLNDFQIEKGDILILEGNHRLSRGEILSNIRAIEIHVPIGYNRYESKIISRDWEIINKVLHIYGTIDTESVSV